MANSFINKKVDLTTTDLTTLYTVPSFKTSIIKSLLVSEDAGSRIIGAIRGRDALYVWTDTALFTQRFVGQPFTFAFAQVGTNCGLVGKNACVEVDGATPDRDWET